MGDIQKLSAFGLDYIKSKGDVKATLTITESEQHEITIKDGKFTLYRTLFDEDVSVKVIKDNRQGTGSINKFDEEAIKKAFDEALSTAEASDADECFDIAPGLEPEQFKMGVLEPDIDKLIERTKELSDTIAERFKKIKLMELYTRYVKGTTIYANTNGTRDEKEFGYYVVAIDFAGNDGENTTGLNGSYAVFDNLDKELITLGSIEQDLKDSENSLNPIRVSEKFEGDVIFTPACVAELFMFIAGVTVTDQAIINKTSQWQDKIGQQVASPLLTISSNLWDKRIVDHEVHTADGFRSKDFTMIDKGVLKSLATTLYTEKKCGIVHAENTANALVIEPGDTALEDMIKSVKKGLIVNRISCGRPGSNGEIAGLAKSSFYVEDGEVKGAVLEAMVSSNLFDIFNNVKAVSKELLCDGSMVVPYLQVSGVTVSGNA